MQIANSLYFQQIHSENITSPCFACNPAMYQAFSTQGKSCPFEYEYLSLSFEDWKYLGYEAGSYLDSDHDDVFEEASTIEIRSISEIEKELINTLPIIPEMAIGCDGIYSACKKGYECFFQNDYLKAIEYYTVASNYELNDDVVFCLSMAYYMNGDHENAVRAASGYKGKFIGFDRFGNDKYDTNRIDMLLGILEKKIA